MDTQVAIEQTSLFGDDEEKESPPPVHEETTTAPESTCEPEDVAQTALVVDEGPGYTAFFREYKAMIDECESRIDSFVSASRAQFDFGYSVGKSFQQGYVYIRETRKDLVDAIYAKAERDFAPSQGSLTIPRTFHVDLDTKSDEDFDPDLLWEELERTFGGEAGKLLGLKETACAIVRAFSMRKSPPQRKRNCLVLQDQIWTEKTFGGDGFELHFNCRQSVQQTLMRMAAFAEWAEHPAEAQRLRFHAGSIWTDRKKTSRQRDELGVIHLVYFQKSMTWELYGDLGDKLQEFVATYGRQAFEER